MTLEPTLFVTKDWILQGSTILVFIVLERIKRRKEKKLLPAQKYTCIALSGEAMYMVGECKTFDVR